MMNGSCFKILGRLISVKRGHGCRWYSSMYARLKKEKAEASPDDLKFSHVYKNMFPWRNLNEFVEQLGNCVIYNEDGLVVLNKPYGVRVAPQPTTTNWTPRSLRNAAVGKNIYSIEDALPQLKELLGYRFLHVLKSATRYESGVTLLSGSDDVTSRIKRCVLRERALKKLMTTYWVVVLGKPSPETGTVGVGITVEVGEGGKKKQPVVVDKFTNASVKRGEVKPVNVEYKVLSYNDSLNVSLVEIKVSRTKWHFLRVFMASKASPILGDNIFGSRVKKLKGVLVTVNPFSDAANAPPKLPKDILECLELREGQELVIPNQVHLYEQQLLKFYGAKGDFTINALPPPSFSWTCLKLGLLRQITEGDDEIKQ